MKEPILSSIVYTNSGSLCHLSFLTLPGFRGLEINALTILLAIMMTSMLNQRSLRPIGELVAVRLNDIKYTTFIGCVKDL